MKNLIPVFFSVNDAYAPYLATALYSIKENASKNYDYRIHILSDDLSDKHIEKLRRFDSEGFRLEFIPLSEKLSCLDPDGRLGGHGFEAFASLTIYFRLFIPALFPQYDKAIYLDSDIIVPGDISRLWEEKLGRNLIGACADYSIQHILPFMKYIDEYVGVDHRNYVNSGVLLMNLKRLREVDLAGRFLRWNRKYRLETVAPDQDYLNVLCWGCIHYLDPQWDAMPSERITSFEDPQIIHFNLASKPWLNESVPYGDLFWKYARRSGFYGEIVRRWLDFISHPAKTEQYRQSVEGLVLMAGRLSESDVSFRSIIASKAEMRLCC